MAAVGARTPTTKCYVCGTPLYRRKSDLSRFEKSYCSYSCRRKIKRVWVCQHCNQSFENKDSNPNRKYCSHKCSNESRRGINYKKLGHHSKSKELLSLLKLTFGLTECMVRGCTYSRTFDLHRLIPGREGGKYEVGNMFAICPNHHAESHRKIIKFIKISDSVLEAIDL